MSEQITTRDLGLAIRDLIEGMWISHFKDDVETGQSDRIQFVDVSDADNPVVHMHSGAQFTIRVVRTG